MKKENAEGRNAPHGPPLSSLLLSLPSLLPKRNWCVVVLYYGVFLGRTYYNAQPYDIGYHDPYDCLARTRITYAFIFCYIRLYIHMPNMKKNSVERKWCRVCKSSLGIHLCGTGVPRDFMKV